MSAENVRDDAAVQRVLGQLIRDSSLQARLEADPEGLLRELGLDPSDRAGMLAFGPSRLLAYNQMVGSRLARTVGEFMPRVVEVVGESALDEQVREWIAELGPRSAYLREVPDEFLTWARPRWREAIAAGVWPAWLIELAEHELLIRALRNDPRPSGAPSEHKIELERALASNPTARLINRRHAVHHLPAKLGAPLPVVGEGTFVLVAWRDAQDRAQVLELEPRPAALLERLLAGQSLREALFGACAALGEALDDAILQSTALTLASWCDRHVLLGAD